MMNSDQIMSMIRYLFVERLVSSLVRLRVVVVSTSTALPRARQGAELLRLQQAFDHFEAQAAEREERLNAERSHVLHLEELLRSQQSALDALKPMSRRENFVVNQRVGDQRWHR